jgi:hypothetical protein
MKNELLDLHHLQLLREKLIPLGNGLSEYGFANLYLFRHVHHYRVVQDEHLFISGKTYDGCSFLMPVFDVQEVNSEYLIHMIGDHDFFFPIHESMLQYFDKKTFSCFYNTDDSDYIYRTEKFIAYTGQRLSAKRNLRRHYLDNFASRSFPLKNNTQTDAEEILEQWLADAGKPVQDTDYLSCREALHYQDRIGLDGTIYYADNEPAGFVLYSEVIPGMCIFHFAKGKQKFKGIYQYMFSHCADAYSDKFSFFNLEQDLGNLNFRKTKLSYDPDQQLHKYRVKPV